VYFVIDSFAQLRAALDADVAALIDEAKRMGDLPARFDAAA
jgi:phenylalanine-4-hydroxylase